MNYDETIKYIQSKCKKDIFRELDEFLTNLDDSQVDEIELDNKKFKIEKNIVDTDFKNGIVKSEYKVNIS